MSDEKTHESTPPTSEPIPDTERQVALPPPPPTAAEWFTRGTVDRHPRFVPPPRRAR